MDIKNIDNLAMLLNSISVFNTLEDGKVKAELEKYILTSFEGLKGDK